jgi:hypothetical protein
MNINKKEFIECFIDTYIKKLQTNNLHFHIEVYKAVQQLEACKKDDEIMEVYKNIKYIYNHNSLKVTTWGNVCKVDEIEDYVNKYVYTLQSESIVLIRLKDLLHEKVYAIICNVYTCLMKVGMSGFETLLILCKYLLGMKSKDVFIVKNNLEIIDILFNILVYIGKTLGDDMYKYVCISRDLMYFKIPKRKVIERVDIFYKTMYVLYTRDLDTTKVQGKPRKLSVNDDQRYLFLLCEGDDTVKMEIAKEREKAMETLLTAGSRGKNIRVKDSGYLSQQSSMNIVKMF